MMKRILTQPQFSRHWSEGLTTYGADLIVARAGLCNTNEFLSLLSSNITSLQNSPGRLKQTLEQAWLDVWTSGTSGVGRDPQNLLNYYVKGPVVGFLLDAKIQRATNGKKSLDDVMRLAIKRYGGKRGVTPEQFRQTAENVAGIDLKESFRKWLASTEELDYTEALDWFGLQFAKHDQPAKAWQIVVAHEKTRRIHRQDLQDYAQDLQDVLLIEELATHLVYLSKIFVFLRVT